MRPNGVIIGILGLWLIIAGIIGFGISGNVWNDLIVGIIVAILGFTMSRAAPGQGFLSGILGLWMIVSAFVHVLHTGAGARWDDIIVGIILAIAGFSMRRKVSGAAADTRRVA